MFTGNDPSRPLNVCLIRPPAVESFRFVTTTITLPLGLAYVAAVAEKAGHNVRVIDAVALSPTTKTRYFKGVLVGLPLPEIAQRIPHDTDVVGITVVFTHEWPAVAKLVQHIRRTRPGLAIVVGGEHVTSMPEFCLATSSADFVVCGEGEETFVELLEALRRGATTFPEINGVGWRDPSAARQVHINARRTRRTDIDDIPYPAWHYFDVRTYNDNHLVGGMDTGLVNLPLLATRGCPYQCTFCSSPNMWTPRWIPRDPVKVVDEIEYMVKTYGARSFPFQDLTAIIQRQWILDFCHELERRNLKISWQFPSGTRSEAIDLEVAQAMHRTGVSSLAYAPESGSEETRKLIKKQMRTDRLMASIDASTDAGLNVTVFLIIGFPHDTDASMAASLPFVSELRALGVTDLGVGYFFALPGTELFDALFDAGKIRLDAQYFSHILQGGDLVPSISHCETNGRLSLMYWKFRLYSRFYGTRNAKREATGGLLTSLRRGLSGLWSGEGHDSKLQTVFRTAMVGGWDELRLAATTGWMSRAEEQVFFADWDRVYRDIRQRLKAQGVLRETPSDTRLLSRENVGTRLKVLHQTARALADI